MAKAKSKDEPFVCKCECGGNVRGVKPFTWCDTCTPVETIKFGCEHCKNYVGKCPYCGQRR